MKLLERIAHKLGYVGQKQVRDVLRRNFDAAMVTRLTSDIRTSESDISNAIRQGGATVRNRARDLSRNNDYVRGVMNHRRANIIGHVGFMLQMDCGEYNQTTYEWQSDEIANRKIEAAWEDWCLPENCSVHKKSFRAIQHILTKYEHRDGEYFVHIVRNRAFKYGIKLQVLEPEAVDERYSERLANGNLVRMGIEYNQYWVPVAFHIKPPNMDGGAVGNLYGWGSPATRQRVPAEDIIFGFDADHITQARGISRLAWSLITIHYASEYEKAALVNARFSANKLAAIGAPDGVPPEGFKGESVDEQTGAQQMDLEPGTLLDIGLNKLYTYDPKYPSEQHEPFMRQILRRFSVGQGQAYSSTSNDLSNANYGSNRVGLLSERELYKMDQEDFKEQFLNPLFRQWLSTALLSQAINLPFNLQKFNRPKFTGRRWQWIDPLKDIAATELAMQLHISTLTDVIAEAGGDVEDNLRKLQREKKLLQKYGIDPDKPGKTVVPDDDDEEPETRRLLDRIFKRKKNGHTKPEEV